ncbi:unnamed protein product, partial [Darwinula stevensoni]
VLDTDTKFQNVKACDRSSYEDLSQIFTIRGIEKHGTKITILSPPGGGSCLGCQEQPDAPNTSPEGSASRGIEKHGTKIMILSPPGGGSCMGCQEQPDAPNTSPEGSALFVNIDEDVPTCEPLLNPAMCAEAHGVMELEDAANEEEMEEQPAIPKSRNKYGQSKEGREGETDRNRGSVGQMLPGSPHVQWQAVGSEAGQ